MQVALYNFRVDNVRVYVNFTDSFVEILDCRVENTEAYRKSAAAAANPNNNTAVDANTPAPAFASLSLDETSSSSDLTPALAATSAPAPALASPIAAGVQDTEAEQ